MPPPPPPNNSSITVYQWTFGPLGSPCGACMQLGAVPSLVRRSSPHAFCVCLGDIPTPWPCTFQGRSNVESETETFEVPGPVIPAGGSRKWTTSASATGSVSVTGEGDGTAATVSGSTTTGESTEWNISNPNDDMALQLFEIWNNINESWVDTVECTVVGFTVTHNIPRSEARQEFGGFISRPFVP